MSQFPSSEVDQLRAQDAKHRGRGTVVVTGASTGIGESTALHLASLGYRVLAGVRKQEDFERMRTARPGIEPVILDVTNPDHIAGLAELVDRTEPGGLTALVNNAGVGVVGPIEELSIEEWRWVLETNVLGSVAVTKALLPSLLRSRGRVINMSSGGGKIAFPLFGPYAASKFAIEGMSDVLRREVGSHGVKVVCVQPGVISTPVYEKTLPSTRERRDRLSPDQSRRYGRQLDSAIKSAEESSELASPPIVVAEAVAKAIGSRFPRTRYIVGWDSRTAVVCSRILPDRLIDLIIRRLTNT